LTLVGDTDGLGELVGLDVAVERGEEVLDGDRLRGCGGGRRRLRLGRHLGWTAPLLADGEGRVVVRRAPRPPVRWPMGIGCGVDLRERVLPVRPWGRWSEWANWSAMACSFGLEQAGIVAQLILAHC
jgi:hypothetical protein